jgi:hypothetical protein
MMRGDAARGKYYPGVPRNSRDIPAIFRDAILVYQRSRCQRNLSLESPKMRRYRIPNPGNEPSRSEQ